MFTVWMIWIQFEDYIYLHSAWDDDSTAENQAGYQDDLGKAHNIAFSEGGEVRVQRVSVPGVSKLFEVPAVVAES